MANPRRMRETLEILLADDNDGCRDLYSLWLEDDHDVQTAPNGKVALDRVEDGTDLVILDWNMPGPSGPEVAEAIAESGYECKILLISSATPDFNIEETPIDEYVEKPADRETITSLVNGFATQQAYQSALSEFYAVSATVARIESTVPETELDGLDQYSQLRQRVEQKQNELTALLEDSEIDWRGAFESLYDAADPDALETNCSAGTHRKRVSRRSG